MHLYGTMKINDRNHLEIGGVDITDIVKEFGTPVYVYDVALIRKQAERYKKAFETAGVPYQVAYASKAFSTVAMVQLADELGLSLDVVSSGEMMTAKRADFPMEKVHFHGNNKSREEIRLAFDLNIGCIVLDNFHDIALVSQEAAKREQKMDVLLRITPGIEAHTHEYIATGQEDSKFGFDFMSGQVEEALRQLQHDPYIHVLGIHSHIGSQIFETDGFVLVIEKIFQALPQWKEKLQFVPAVLNVGGGFGIRYTKEDQPLRPEQYVTPIIDAIKQEAMKAEMDIPEIWIEPGRSIVGEAGTTLYTVGAQKEVPNVRRYISVDGGMTDNIRPALYDAKYEAILANRANDPVEETFSIAGKCCESGDMLIWDIPLPEPKDGDILAVFATGAYGYSMANNYNRFTKPPVVFVEDGQCHLVVKRESIDDLLKNDLPLYSPERV